jgi:parallel beta-helix repeat protein
MRNQLIGILMISALTSAANAASPTVLTTCGLLGLPGNYVLANDVVAPATGQCLLIMAEVNLNMDGHSITPGTTAAGVGVRVVATGAGSRIHDGSIAGLGIGIRIEGASLVRVTGMTITGNNTGIYLIGADNNRLDGNNVSNNSDVGFQVDSGSDNNSFVGEPVRPEWDRARRGAMHLLGQQHR